MAVTQKERLTQKLISRNTLTRCNNQPQMPPPLSCYVIQLLSCDLVP